MTDQPNLAAAPLRSATAAYPLVHDAAPSGSSLTIYDREHFLTYARILDADRDRMDWRAGVRTILDCDPAVDLERARRCWESHLERARAILAGTIVGLEDLEG